MTRPGAGAPSLVLAGGQVLTLDATSRVVEAVAVRGDRIVATGSAADVTNLADRAPASSTWAAGPYCPASTTPTCTEPPTD